MKIAIVSGAGGNLGSAIVNRLLTEDFTVIGTTSPRGDSSSEEKKLHLVPVDLTDAEAADKFVRETVSKYGCPEIVVLTVGGFSSGKIAETTTEDILAQYKLNFLSTYNLARPVFNEMMKQGSGRIYMTGAKSAMHMESGKGIAAYAMSKSLVFRLNELLNLESKAKDFQSTIIVPTTIDTPQNRIAMPDADFSKWTKPEDIAGRVIAHYQTNNNSPILDVSLQLEN